MNLSHQGADFPTDESARLRALQQYEILDTEPEQAYDDITLLAAILCHTPIAVISLADHRRQWFKSHRGLSILETERKDSFCGETIWQKTPLIIPDALLDERFAQSELVIHEPKVRFYAGFPLVNADHHAVGCLCVMDRQPGALTPEQHQALEALTRQVMSLLEGRRVSNKLAQALHDVSNLSGLLPICAWCKKIRVDQGVWEEIEIYLAKQSDTSFTHSVCPTCASRQLRGASR